MIYKPQSLRFTHGFQPSKSIWLNPATITGMEITTAVEEQDQDPKDPKVPARASTKNVTKVYTVGPKVFYIKEHPDEVNRIIRDHKIEVKKVVKTETKWE